MRLWRNKLFWFVLVLTLVCSTLMVFSWLGGKPTPASNLLGAVISPLQRGVSGAAGFFENIFGYFYRYSALEEENAMYRQIISEYQQLESEYYAAINENIALRELASLLEKHKDFICEPCELISYSSGSLAYGFTVNRGSLHDIEEGDAVITEDGLVGYVSAVGVNYAQVVGIIDMTSKVAAMISRTRETVVAEGSFELLDDGLMRISYLRNDTEVRPGDMVETSGYGGIYPKGLLIGRVREVLPESHGISSYAIIEPIVDFSALTHVFVVKDYQIVE